VAVVALLGFLVEQTTPSIRLAFDGCAFSKFFMRCWNCGGLWPCWEWEGCHCFFVGISLGYGKNYFRSCSTMKRVKPAPTISPMI